MKTRFNIYICLLFVLSSATGFAQFKVVLDAGHGGGDTGTNHNSYKEKDIVLSTVIKIGKILEKEPGFDVVYTRKTDVFIELRERAHIANREKADLFVSIHCNGVNAASASGTETFVMGLDRSNMNMEVARKENSVIYQEKDYKIKYKGFDPNRPDTSIGLALQQEESLNQSLLLATKVKDGFRRLKKNDRGIKQQPLWVLDATTMPGVLIELGFVSNKAEGAYLNSEDGQDELAHTIANAIISYKELLGGKSGGSESVNEISAQPEKVSKEEKEIVKEAAVENGVVFKIQISASTNNLETKPSNFKGLKNITKIKEGRMIKYFYGETDDYNETSNLLSQAKAKGFSSAYVVPFKNGKIISMKEALK